MINHEYFFGDEYLTAEYSTIEEGIKAKNRYLQLMQETEQEAIYRLNKYCLVPWNYDPFDYFDDLIIDFINDQEMKYTEINTAGGRFGSKTYKITDFVVKLIKVAMKYRLKVAFYGFRLFGADIVELKKSILDSLNRYGFKQSESPNTFKNGQYIYSGNHNVPYFRFLNGSFIYLKGVYKANDRTIALKGLASANDMDLAVSFQEEANEISNKESQAINMAIRGAKKRLYFKASNPDELFQDYIFYCDKNSKFDERQLKTKGEQFKKVFDPETGRGKIFHYTNHMINPYLTKAEVIDILELKKNDPYQYRSWGIGMPGGLETAIFSPYLTDKVKEFKGDMFVAGLDLGYATSQHGHPTRLIISEVSFSTRKPRVHPIKEYYHSNATMKNKNIEVIMEDLIMILVNFAEQNPIVKHQGLTVQVDYGAGGLPIIDLLNKKCWQLYDPDLGKTTASWLKFQPVDKKVWFIKDRIDITISMLSSGKLTLSLKDTPELFKEMKMIQWKKQKNILVDNTPKMVDLNDDGWDALMYSLMPIIHQILADWKGSALYEKKYNKVIRKKQLSDDDIYWGIDNVNW